MFSTQNNVNEDKVIEYVAEEEIWKVKRNIMYQFVAISVALCTYIHRAIGNMKRPPKNTYRIYYKSIIITALVATELLLVFMHNSIAIYTWIVGFGVTIVCCC